MTRAEREKQRAVLDRLRRDATSLATHFRLPLGSIDAERAQVKRRYGVCYEDGTIRVRLRHARTGRLIKYSGLIDTLCHELAHLRYFNHGMRFQRFYRKLLAHARRVRIYQPDPRRIAPPRPRPQKERPQPLQLDLFF